MGISRWYVIPHWRSAPPQRNVLVDNGGAARLGGLGSTFSRFPPVGLIWTRGSLSAGSLHPLVPFLGPCQKVTVRWKDGGCSSILGVPGRPTTAACPS